MDTRTTQTVDRLNALTRTRAERQSGQEERFFGFSLANPCPADPGLALCLANFVVSGIVQRPIEPQANLLARIALSGTLKLVV